MAKFAIEMFGDAVARFEAAQAEVLQEWQPPCGCDAPGFRPECRTCSDCHQLRILTQMKLSAAPETVFPPALPPPTTQAYPLDVKQQAVELYAQGVALNQIQAVIGVKNRQAIREWAKAANIAPRIEFYSPEVREHCLRLYQLGNSPGKIEELTEVPADTIRGWAHDTGIIRNPAYPSETKAHCLMLYQQGDAPKTIAQATGVPVGTIRRWVAAAKLSRTPGRPRQYPDEIRNQCLRLRQEGKDYREIEVLIGVSESTIREWVKQQS